MAFVYILKSDSIGRYYIGCTSNLQNRLKLHNSGRVRSTKAYQPWKVVHTEEADSLSLARKRELQIKKWKSRSMIEDLIRKTSDL